MGGVAAALALAVLLAGCGAGSGDTGADPSPDEAGAVADSPAPAAPATPAAPDSGEPGSEGPATADAAAGEWTAGIVEGVGRATGQAVLRDVRIGRHESYDRVTFELDAVPGYHLEYVDRPVRQCGSGHVVEIAGDGWLHVRLHSARAHTEAGEPTIGWRERTPDLPVIREVERICDFEGEVGYVLGVRSPNPYRVLTLEEPARLVVDVRH